METIKKLISEGKTEEAISLLKQHIALHPNDDYAWYLQGNAHRKTGETRQAINCYLQAIELNPDSPALHTYKMLINIMNFYNKDMYNH